MSGRGVPAAAVLASALSAPAAVAGEADVLAAEATCDAQWVCSFSASVRHADSSWDHDTNAWQVVTESGQVLATRVLQPPHVNEQPFTRTLAGVAVPPGVARVRVRAIDSQHGGGGRELVVLLPAGEAGDRP